MIRGCATGRRLPLTRGGRRTRRSRHCVPRWRTWRGRGGSSRRGGGGGGGRPGGLRGGGTFLAGGRGGGGGGAGVGVGCARSDAGSRAGSSCSSRVRRGRW